MRKQIKQQGSQIKITFTVKELELYGWKIGNILDLSDVFVIAPEKAVLV